MEEEYILLFFDTFSHESCEELNLDLVQFPSPVFITEIRVIPLGARVQADFPGGHRLGATNPSSFQLQFFVNDLTKRCVCTFQELGNFQYKQNVEIQFPVTKRIITDGLVLRGLYSTITLAIYGVLAKTTTKERVSPPPPPPPQAITRPPDHRSITDPSIPSEWDHHQISADVTSDTHSHAQGRVDTARFSEVPAIIHPPQEQHVAYSTEIPQPVYSEPAPNIVYPECIPTSVPSVPQAPQYQQYDSRYSKQWQPLADEHYPNDRESYDSQGYRPSDPGAYPQSQMWDSKECRPSEISVIHERGMHSRSKDRREKPWDGDSNLPDYKDEDLSRDRDYKRKDRDRRSWERGPSDSDRYRDRMKESSGRDRDKERERDRGRDKTRSHDSYSDRAPRSSVKRPVTPPTPPPPAHVRPPQTPPDLDKMVGGPRTPKEEEPSESFEELSDIRGSHANDYYDMSPERRIGEPMYSLSEGEIQEGDNTEDDDGYEEIVSEEEIMSDGEDRVLDMADIVFDLGDESWNYMSSFSPYHCELTSFQYFDNPALSEFEISVVKQKEALQSQETPTKENKILAYILSFKGQAQTEKWVEALESITSSDFVDFCVLTTETEYKDAMDTLLEWVIQGLDFDLALKQAQTAYKVRHIKAGIRVANILLRTNIEIFNMLLEKEVPRLLLQLFDQPFMVLPIKLLILRALDAVCYFEKGCSFLLNRTCAFLPPKDFKSDNWESSDEPVLKTGYQKLLDMLISNQRTRIVVSISVLIAKIHLYEVLRQLHTTTDNLIKSISNTETKSSTAETSLHSMDIDSSSQNDIEPSEHINLASSDENNVLVILTCLNDITSDYRDAWRKLAQPKRLLPARNLLEFPKSPFDPYPDLVRMFKDNHLLETILSILLNPELTSHMGVMGAIKELLLELLHSQYGMLYLLSQTDTINSIQKVLLQNVDESRDENGEDNMISSLGMQIVYRLQALLYVDALLAYHSKDQTKKEFDYHDAVSTLHHLYTMVFSSVGRSAVVDVLSLDKNLNALLPFVQVTGDQERDSKLRKSACAAYVTELLMINIHYLENVSVLENFSETLYSLSQQEATPKLHELAGWMMPTTKIPNYTYEAVPYLAEVLKSHFEDAATLPPELITVVRILKHICLSVDQETDELKYTFAIIQFFSNDGLSSFLSILQAVCENFLKPSHQSVALVGQQGVLVIALMKPIISIIKSTLAHLISCRGPLYQDLTAVPVLMQAFSLMMMVPTSSFSYHLGSGVQNDIIEVLLTYTLPTIAPEEKEDSLSKSLWTRMVQEVLKYSQQSPRCFLTGLSVLSELLPLPLPLHAREPLHSKEIDLTVNHRKLWSAHLHPLGSKIQELIVSLAGTSCHPLQQLLRRVCIQLSDLAIPTALITARAVVDCLMDTFETESKESTDPARPEPLVVPCIKACSTSTLRILNFISYLVSHSSFKIPLMFAFKASTIVDEKYSSILQHLLGLLNFSSENPVHIQSQECIVSILQSLCDPYIGFVSMEGGASINEVLASCLPCKEHIVDICTALIQHIGNSSHQYASILPSLRSLIMLAEHDYGFYYVRQCLNQFPEALRSLFSRLSGGFSNDNTDCFSTLSTTLEFLRLMVNGYEESVQTGRSMLLPTSELGNWLAIPPTTHKVKQEVNEDTKTSKFHLLLQLEKSLSVCSAEEEAVESLLDSLSSLILLLNEGSAKDEKTDSKNIIEPTLPSPEVLTTQFTSRTVFILGEVEEDRLNPAYWLSVPVNEDAEQEQEQVPVDMVGLAEKCISGDFNLKCSLDSLCTSVDAVADMKKEKCISSYNGKRRIQSLGSQGTDGGIKRRFIAPMRGRGFSRATTHSTRANDPFRSRPPNTSRPPSMHVDDFVALESHHTGPANQTQQKRQEGTRGRGRGFDRGQVFPSLRGGSGGRFFSSTGPYGRRDGNTRGGTRGAATRISNNAWSNRANSNLAKSTSGSGTRTNFNTRPSGSERCNYGSSFLAPEPRLTGQRNRDNYVDIPLNSGTASTGRFTRGGVRTTDGVLTPVQGHWESRNKSQNQRFLSTMTPARGNAHRDLSAKHTRSFIR